MDSYNAELNRTIEFTKLADTKATWLSTLLLASLGYWITRATRVLGVNNIWTHWILPLSVVFFGVLALYHIIRVFMPRTSHSNISESSLIYHGTISKMSLKEFVKSRSRLTTEDLRDEYLSQIFITSVIANKKMHHVKLGLLFFVMFASLSGLNFYLAYLLH